MLQANSCKLLRGWGLAKPRDTIGYHRIIDARQTLRNTLQQLSFLVFLHRPLARVLAQLMISAAGLRQSLVSGFFDRTPSFSSVWTRLGPSDEHPISFSAPCCCTPSCFASSPIERTPAKLYFIKSTSTASALMGARQSRASRSASHRMASSPVTGAAIFPASFDHM